MVSALGLVICVIVLYELRGVGGQRVNHASGSLVRAAQVVLGALCVELLAHLVTCVGVVVGIEIAVGCVAADVIHG